MRSYELPPGPGVLSHPWERQIYNQQVELLELREQLRRDSLTGLYNDRAFHEEVKERISNGDDFGVVYIDMDGFKAVNDTLGHEAGNTLLKGFSSFLDSTLQRKADLTSYHRSGRLGGDEFGIVLDLSVGEKRRGIDVRTKQERMADMLEILSLRIKQFIQEQPTEVQQTNFDVSLGGAAYEPDMTGEDLDRDKIEKVAIDLVSKADTRMLAAKGQRKVESYTAEQRQAALQIGAIAAKNNINLRDVPIVLPLLKASDEAL